MREARRRYTNDDQARQEAFARIYAKHQPATPNMWGCWLRLLLSLAVDLPAPWSPLKQGLPDRLAGTVVVLERRGGLLDRSHRARAIDDSEAPHASAGLRIASGSLREARAGRHRSRSSR
jgi:hypothetical protein